MPFFHAQEIPTKRNDRYQEISSEGLMQDRAAAIVDAYYRINAKSTFEGGG
jgi:hypothetical protein